MFAVAGSGDPPHMSDRYRLSIHDPGVAGGVAEPPPGTPDQAQTRVRPRQLARPLVFGYVRAPLAVPQARSASASLWRTAIARFATREGFTLAQVFVEARGEPPWTSLTSLLEAARFTPVTAVVVPDITHLGHTVDDCRTHRELIERQARCHVIAIHLSPDENARPDDT